jgi:hypothetical protein
VLTYCEARTKSDARGDTKLEDTEEKTVTHPTRFEQDEARTTTTNDANEVDYDEVSLIDVDSLVSGNEHRQQNAVMDTLHELDNVRTHIEDRNHANMLSAMEEMENGNADGNDHDEGDEDDQVDSALEAANTYDDLIKAQNAKVMKQMEARRARKQKLSCQPVRTLEATLSKNFKTMPDAQMASDSQEILEVLSEKYHGEKDTSLWKITGIHVKHPQRHEEFVERIGGTEERSRPWMKSMEDSADFPQFVMRCWDEISQCQIKDPTTGFLSGGSANLLTTNYNRTRALTQHADWRNRVKTAFISTTSSLREIEEIRVPHMQNRQAKKKVKDYTRFSVINVNAILAKGKPIMRMKDELRHYDVKDRFGKPRLEYWHGSYYENEYIVPFSISPDAIVNTWPWREIQAWMEKHGSFAEWVRCVGRPAYEKHEAARVAQVAEYAERKKGLERKKAAAEQKRMR